MHETILGSVTREVPSGHAGQREPVLARNPRVAYRELNDGSAVLLHLDTGAYHGVNDVGALVWGVLEARLTVPELIEAIRGRFDESPPTLVNDVRVFVDQLLERGLLVANDHEGTIKPG